MELMGKHHLLLVEQAAAHADVLGLSRGPGCVPEDTGQLLLNPQVHQGRMLESEQLADPVPDPIQQLRRSRGSPGSRGARGTVAGGSRVLRLTAARGRLSVQDQP